MEKKHIEIEILFVEDNKNDAELTIRALKKSNIANKLIHFKDGAQPLDFLFGRGEFEGRNTDNKPKVILLDLKLPKVHGIEVLKELKSSSLTKDIPVVILTSSKEDPDIQRCYDLGANSYIVKPVDFERFSKAIAEVGLYWMLLNEPPR